MFKHIISTYDFEPILLEKANGSWVWDTEGRKYLDCVSGTWSCNLGHNHPKIIENFTILLIPLDFNFYSPSLSIDITINV